MSLECNVCELFLKHRMSLEKNQTKESILIQISIKKNRLLHIKFMKWTITFQFWVGAYVIYLYQCKMDSKDKFQIYTGVSSSKVAGYFPSSILVRMGHSGGKYHIRNYLAPILQFPCPETPEGLSLASLGFSPVFPPCPLKASIPSPVNSPGIP